MTCLLIGGGCVRFVYCGLTVARLFTAVKVAGVAIMCLS